LSTDLIALYKVVIKQVSAYIDFFEESVHCAKMIQNGKIILAMVWGLKKTIFPK